MYELMGREGNEIEEAKAILNRSIMRQSPLPENLFYVPPALESSLSNQKNQKNTHNNKKEQIEDKKTEQGEKNEEEDKSTLHVVAVATSVRSELKNLNHSVSGVGFDLKVLGMNTKWQGFGSKVFYMIDWLKEAES